MHDSHLYLNPVDLWYLAPIVPWLVRGTLIVRYRRVMSDVLSEEAQDIDAHRVVLIGWVTISFTGLLGLAIVDATLRAHLQLQLYLLLISFLSYTFTLNLQGYKHRRWRDHTGDALMETGLLCLLLAVATVIQVTYPNTFYGRGMTLLAVGVWAVDFVVRVRGQQRFLSALTRRMRRDDDARRRGQTEVAGATTASPRGDRDGSGDQEPHVGILPQAQHQVPEGRNVPAVSLTHAAAVAPHVAQAGDNGKERLG